jgi:hypothetical protein
MTRRLTAASRRAAPHDERGAGNTGGAPRRADLLTICNNSAPIRGCGGQRGLGALPGRPRRRYGVDVIDRAYPQHEDIDLTEHAVEQYRERVRPALDLTAARVELAQLVPSGQICNEPPDWARSAGAKPYYLVIGDALALPLASQVGRWVTTTCLVQTTLTPRRREERTRRRAQRAAAKRARRRASW